MINHERNQDTMKSTPDTQTRRVLKAIKRLQRASSARYRAIENLESALLSAGSEARIKIPIESGYDAPNYANLDEFIGDVQA